MLFNNTFNRLRSLLQASGLLRSKFAFNVTSTLLAQVTLLGLTIASAAIVARVLGPQGKGLLSLAALAPGLLGLFLSAGIGAANVYYAGSRSLEIPALTGNSITFTLGGTLLGFLLVAIFSVAGWLEALLPGVPSWLIWLALTILPFSLLGNYLGAILQGLQRITELNKASVTQGFLAFALTILLVLVFPLGVAGAVVAIITGSAFYCLLLTRRLGKEAGRFAPTLEPTVIRTTLSYGLRGYLGNLLQFFNYRLDMFIVNFYLGPAGVGIYSVSVRLAELLWYLPNAVGYVIFPKAASSSPEVMNRFTPRIFQGTLILTALGAVVLVFLGKPLILFIYTQTFSSAYLPLLALLPGVVLMGSAKVLTNEIAGRGYPLYNSINSGVSLVLTIILDLVLIPSYGILGAGMASSISYTLTFFTAIAFYLFVSRKP